ncbi:MAG: 4'-phosphopantetheinyl transferase superfamily protein [Streptomycetaceae bacterium]|nr:4'-phosphopantetheinyl transferase superfamily protein [Streptomycetaceae bacterium]
MTDSAEGGMGTGHIGGAPPTGLLARILPPQVLAEECFDDPPGTVLFPEEEERIARAVDKRRREFTTVRRCARLALTRLGVTPGPLVPGERGAPSWPEGVVGSMTHCQGYRAAAVASAARVLTVGIDAEPALALPDGVLDSVSSPEERKHLAECAGATQDQIPWDRLLFSAKESVYKAWFPLTRRWLGFEDAEIEFTPADGTFHARLLVADKPLTGFAGRWTVANGIALTAITVTQD